MLPRRFGAILEKVLDRHKRSEIAAQWNGGLTVMNLDKFAQLYQDLYLVTFCYVQCLSCHYVKILFYSVVFYSAMDQNSSDASLF